MQTTNESISQLELGFPQEAPGRCLPVVPAKALRFASQFRLRAGDVIRLEDEACRVIRVSESAAVVEVPQPPKEFETAFGKRVRIQPRPKLVRIASNSDVPILKREGGAL